MAKRGAKGKPVARPRRKLATKSKAGRKTKLTPERTQTLAGLIRRGIPETSAVRLAGITIEPFYRWIREGKADIEAGKEDTAKAQFAQAITRARDEGELFLADKWRKIVTEGTAKRVWKDIIVKETTERPDGSKVTTEKVVRVLDREELTGDGDWKGIESYLERRWPETWARPKARVEVEDVTAPETYSAREKLIDSIARRRSADGDDGE